MTSKVGVLRRHDTAGVPLVQLDGRDQLGLSRLRRSLQRHISRARRGGDRRQRPGHRCGRRQRALHDQHWFESSGNIDVDVGCHTPAGDWSDSPFVVSFVKLPGGAALSADGAYLRTNPGGAALSPGFQWGAPITRSHPATGQYQITLGGVSSLGGTVVVTTYGWSRAYCKPADWVVDGADTKINVRCFDPGGAATDTGFSLRYIRHTRDSRFGSGGFVWANQPTALDYTPSPIYQENRLASECGDHFFTNNAHRVAKGRYQITYPSQMVDVPPSARRFVTAYGSGNEYCKLTNWEAPSSIPGAVRIGTRCFDATGSLVDTRFTEVYFSQAFLIC